MNPYLSRPAAADRLTERTERSRKFTSQGLANLASDGKGPPYAIIQGRAVYRVDELDAWLDEEYEKNRVNPAAAGAA